ncbi:MAG: 1-phosphofructokinase [Ruminococcaceae bacterium]|nr:1-phosphofructokinase [Oscillospiraceae bacterium]
MIYTVTLNPALDYVVKVNELRTDNINRADEATICYGGKGINVSVILTRLGVKNKALGFVAGFTGERLEQMLKSEGIDCDFNRLKNGTTRINVKIRAAAELDINADGPEISNSDVEELLKKLDRIQEGDYLVLSGSVPKTLPSDIYERMLKRLMGRGVKFAVDTTGDLLLNALKYKPFLVKPNHHELGDLFGVTIKIEADVLTYAKRLQNMGAKNVLVSRAEDGAILLDENGFVHKAKNADGTLVNSVGCGDSMVGGFVAACTQTKDYARALRLGTACGNATAFSDALAKKTDIERIYELLNTDSNNYNT